MGKRWRTRGEIRRAVQSIEVEGQSANAVMVKMGYSKKTADHDPKTLTAHPDYIQARNDLQKSILEYNPDYFKKLAQTAVDGLDAKKVSHFAFEGKVIDSKVDDDFVARHKYLETGARLFGFLKDKSDASVQVFNPSQFFLLIQSSEGERPGLAQVEG